MPGTVTNPGGAQSVYGGCEGHDSMYVKLIAGDGHEFIIKREYALVSERIRKILESGQGSSAARETKIYFRELRSDVLQKVCTYFTYRRICEHYPIGDFEIELKEAEDVVKAAGFLEC